MRSPVGGRLLAGSGVGGGRAVGTARTLRHRRGGLGISDEVGECSILQPWRDSATMSQNSWPRLSKKNMHI